MSLAVIRQYIELVRQGPGNEHERLELLRRHQNHVEVPIDVVDVGELDQKASRLASVARTGSGSLSV
ncbi:hypothetical protein ABZ128_13550 [Streptomyces sp. NPDC006326]|uniref:hypothetical protein n=1 Tax=Streptomyces sp. NPDC006326 TaxID=3156752 RepID=UPI0033A8B4FF